MDFDERRLEAKHIRAAIRRYLQGDFQHRPAKSAFLLHEEKRLPAKFILKLAFEEATGVFPPSETLTGGKASVRVLKNLGFDAIYLKPQGASGRRNPVKNARREAFRRILEARWGRVETEVEFEAVRVPDLANRNQIPAPLRGVLSAVEGFRDLTIRGRKNYRLRFDLFLADAALAVEFDERQHFTPLRAVSLRAYPPDAVLGFDKDRWIRLSEEIRAGDNSPIYRDEQRAFYDAIRDLTAPAAGLKPVVRIFEEDVAWEREGSDSRAAQEILRRMESIIRGR